MRKEYLFACTFILLTACAHQPVAETRWNIDQVVIGMSTDEVVNLLGPPALETKDKSGRDAWLYDTSDRSSYIDSLHRAGFLTSSGELLEYTNTQGKKMSAVILKLSNGKVVDISVSY